MCTHPELVLHVRCLAIAFDFAAFTLVTDCVSQRYYRQDQSYRKNIPSNGDVLITESAGFDLRGERRDEGGRQHADSTG